MQAIANAVKGCVRDADLVFRKGGEELVAVLGDVSPAAAPAADERFRLAVEQLAIPHAGSPVSPVVTVTVGVATGHAGHSVRQLLLAAADEAMAAKVNHQRNRVHQVHLPAQAQTSSS